MDDMTINGQGRWEYVVTGYYYVSSVSPMNMQHYCGQLVGRYIRKDFTNAVPELAL